MDKINPFDILSYGVIGLGFLLAFLAYRLLSREQSQERPRRVIVRAIYIFMVFSVALCIVGFASEFIRKSDTSSPKTKVSKDNSKWSSLTNASLKTNEEWIYTSTPVERLFEKGPICLFLEFQDFELRGPEPQWQYTFFNDRLRFKAGRHNRIGRYIVDQRAIMTPT